MRELQLCELCENPTSRTVEDQLTISSESGNTLIVCEDCYDDAVAQPEVEANK